MLSSKGFDLWAGEYDKSVGCSDEDGTYPFAGYRALLNEIYNRILGASAEKVLDLGFGTATLTAKLYEQGCEIYGQDFSEEMLRRAREKMPHARLYYGDFSRGLAEPLLGQRYDAIVATYSLHHLTDAEKVPFLLELRRLLQDGGCIYVGDVAFQTREELERCRETAGEEWDDEEIYFVFDELKPHLPELQFEQLPPCAGLLTLAKA